MSLDALRPLPATLPLNRLFDQIPPGPPIGVWVRGGSRPLRLRGRSRGHAAAIVASGDLRHLLARCALVAVRRGEHLAVLSAERVIGWRALQVAAALPCGLGLAELVAQFPGLECGADGITVPLDGGSPEAVLAACVRERVAVRSSRVLRLD